MIAITLDLNYFYDLLSVAWSYMILLYQLAQIMNVHSDSAVGFSCYQML